MIEWIIIYWSVGFLWVMFYLYRTDQKPDGSVIFWIAIICLIWPAFILVTLLKKH